MNDFKIIVRIGAQRAELYRGNELLRAYPISSARDGVGCEVGSLRTPMGLHRIARKIGEGSPSGTVFRSRIPSGETWSTDPANPLHGSADDLVLSRIL